MRRVSKLDRWIEDNQDWLTPMCRLISGVRALVFLPMLLILGLLAFGLLGCSATRPLTPAPTSVAMSAQDREWAELSKLVMAISPSVDEKTQEEIENFLSTKTIESGKTLLVSVDGWFDGFMKPVHAITYVIEAWDAYVSIPEGDSTVRVRLRMALIELGEDLESFKRKDVRHAFEVRDASVYEVIDRLKYVRAQLLYGAKTIDDARRALHRYLGIPIREQAPEFCPPNEPERST